jgi:DNA-binding CsgD family transcriptional regulator
VTAAINITGSPPWPSVIITGSFPAFAAGLAAILRAEGFDATCRPDLEACCRAGGSDVLLVIVEPGQVPGTDPGRLAGLSGFVRDGLVLVVMLVSPEPADYIRALRAGAHAVLDWHASPTDVLCALRAALAGHTVLPTSVARSLASAAPLPASAVFSRQEVRWLRLLAAGGSVARLAHTEGYSQREVFRRLSGLYKRIGARNRPEAIALAARYGLLTADESQSQPAGQPVHPGTSFS